MTKSVASIVFVFLLLAAAPASAQFCQDPLGTHMGGVFIPNAQLGRWDRGGYPPCTLDDYRRMADRYGRRIEDRYGYPMSMNGYGYDPYGRRTPQAMGVCGYAECVGLVGTFHAEKGILHFRPYDESNDRVGTMGGGMLGTLGGAAIGGAIGGRKGAAIGSVIGGVGGGYVASRHGHDNCMVIQNPTATAQPQQAEAPPQPRTTVPPVPTVQSTTPPVRSGDIDLKFEVRNPWPVDAIVYYVGDNGDPSQIPAEKWVIQRGLWRNIPRRDGVLTARITLTKNGGFEDKTLIIKGDGRKFVIPALP